MLSLISLINDVIFFLFKFGSLPWQDKSVAEKLSDLTLNNTNLYTELEELRKVLFESYDENKYLDIEFPYDLSGRKIAIVGGVQTLANEMMKMIPGLVYIHSATDNDNRLKAADEIWFQAYAMSHSMFYKYRAVATSRCIPFHYFGSKSARRCAEQMVIHFHEIGNDEIAEKYK